MGNWVYKNWDIINGVSFLPYDGGKYKLAPYEEIDVHSYERLIKKLPVIDYSKLSKYELEDNTQGKAEYACIGDKCDICLLYTSPSPRDGLLARMPSSA